MDSISPDTTVTYSSNPRVEYFNTLTKDNLKLRKALTPKLTKYIPNVPTPKQNAFLVLSDILEIFYGGAASGGKSDALLMAGLQYVDVPGYSGLLLRRTFRELSLPSALLDRATNWLGKTDATWRPAKYTWSFPTGATLTFGYLQHEADVYQYDSAEFQFIGFDELTQFTETQYRFMFGRLRRKKHLPVPLRMRSASNPGGVGHLWCKERFIKNPKPGRVFIPAKKADNPHVDQEQYDLALAELDPVLRAQRAEGNWDAEHAGNMFKRSWFKIVNAIPIDSRSVRFWDLASTHDGGDWTVGTKVHMDNDNRVFVSDVVRGQWGPFEVEKIMKQTAILDGSETTIGIEQEPGSSGKIVVENYIRLLAGFDVKGVPSSSKKTTKWKPLAAQAEAGNVHILSDSWNSTWIDEMNGVPNTKHDDQADSVAGSYNLLASVPVIDYGISFLGG